MNPQAPFGGFKMSGLGRELYVAFEVPYTCILQVKYKLHVKVKRDVGLRISVAFAFNSVYLTKLLL